MMKDLIGTDSPDYLLVSDRPITEFDAVVERLSRDQIKEKFGLDYNETIVQVEGHTFPSFSEKHSENESYFEVMKNRLLERLQQPLNDSLVVCHIDAEVGKGVFVQ